MKRNPKISIVTVVYNGELTLESTILSVVNQDYQDTEFIVIDGGSTDSTIDIIKKYESNITHWVSESDKGIYDAMNKGLQLATGDWLIFIGCDDLVLNVLHRIAPILTDNNSLYYGNAFFNKELLIYDGEFNGFKLSKRNICHQAIFYPKSIYKNRKYDLNYRILADYNYNIISFGDRSITFVYLPFLISVFNQYGCSNQNVDKIFLKDKYSIVGENISFVYAVYIKIYDFFKEAG